MKTFTAAAAVLGIALSSSSSAQNFSTFHPETPHVFWAEKIAYDIWMQAKFGILTTLDENDNVVSTNRYGASWAQADANILHYGLDEDSNQFELIPASNFSVCGNFVTMMLERAYGWDWSNYGTGTVSPNAREYKALIDSEDGFARVPMAQAQTGDIIAIDYQNGAPGDSGNPSGHVMIVRRPLGVIRTTTKANSQGSATDEKWAITKHAYRIYGFEIADSTSTPHDAMIGGTDSRRFTVPVGNNREIAVSQQGAGVGEFYVIATLQDEVIGYVWTTSGLPTHSNGVYSILTQGQNQGQRPLAFGRLSP